MWSDDGVEIAHGHDEELIFLQFQDRGRRLRLVSATPALPRRIADALASAWFGRPCRYAEDLLSAHPAVVKRMVGALVAGTAPGLRLVQIDVREAPLAGQPDLILRASGRHPDLRPAIESFEATAGSLLEEPCRIRTVTLSFGSREVLIEFPPENGPPLVRFSDGRLPRSDAEAFRALVAAHFGLSEHLPLRSAG